MNPSMDLHAPYVPCHMALCSIVRSHTYVCHALYMVFLSMTLCPMAATSSAWLKSVQLIIVVDWTYHQIKVINYHSQGNPRTEQMQLNHSKPNYQLWHSSNDGLTQNDDLFLCLSSSSFAVSRRFRCRRLSCICVVSFVSVSDFSHSRFLSADV